MLYLDIPTTADLTDLAKQRSDACISIFLPTTPISMETRGDRIVLKNLSKEAVAQLEAAGVDKRRVRALAEELDDLVDDEDFWRFQANGLVIYATPDNIRSFRIPNALEPMVKVSDRFHIKPLLRATTFRNTCYVLALASGGTRLIEVSADLPPTVVKVEGMPTDAASTIGAVVTADLVHSGRVAGPEEEKKIRLKQFVRKVDASLRGLLGGGDVPLVLASVENLGALYRSVNTYPHLAAQGIRGNPERQTDAELAAAARTVLDELNQAQITAWVELFNQRSSEGRATTDVAQAARAATFGGVQSLLVDMDLTLHGTVDESSGRVDFAVDAGANSYGVVDEIARRVLLTGGQVLSVRHGDIPQGKPLAAILRYPL